MTAERLLTLQDLSHETRSRAMAHARQWRLARHPQILLMLSAHFRAHQNHLKYPAPCPPEGDRIFHPEDWQACHWEWMSLRLRDQCAQQMGARQP